MRRTAIVGGALALLWTFIQPSSAFADYGSAGDINPGNTAWMLISSALVLMMTAPGLALFYGGLVRKKNILGVMMQCIFLMGMMSVLWAAVGFSFAFSGDNPYFGDFKQVALQGVLPTWDQVAYDTTYKAVLEKETQEAVAGGSGEEQATAAAEEVAEAAAHDAAFKIPMHGDIPEALFMMFQGMFFIITPALICGAFAERMKFSTMCVFCALWGLLVYCPVCHWVWADAGWLLSGQYEAIDFAGGTVVHITSGASALVCAYLVGKRLGFGQEPMPPHNLTYTYIGAGLLWVGWFGFNAGSALAANELAVNAFVSTHMAAAAGVLSWSIAEWVERGKPSILGACSGAVAGLVCITPAAGSVGPIYAILMGFVAGYVCFFACTTIKNRFGYDDSLDAFGVHGVGGTLGAILAGVFATKAASAGNYAGLIDGNPGQVLNQVVSVVAAMAFAVVITIVLLKILDATMGLRVSQDDEIQGLDVSQHGEEGYIFQ
ncbi:MAG: ammonium transporter [Planctomycetaceae bacterium]|nr:ammonium transporter [Planctomycetaceae bacterium]MCB9953855.1 ammonium transporter [Planctomycetaceae bacterium]